MPCFIAELEDGEPAPKPELAELMGDLVILDMAELRCLIADGTIRDSFTLSMITRAWALGLLPAE